MSSTDTVTGTRGVYLADTEEKLPYRVVDADNHFYPTSDAIDRYLDPKMRERALLPGETFTLENEEDIQDVKEVDAHPIDEVRPPETPDNEPVGA